MADTIKEKLLRYYKGTDGEEAAIRSLDLIEQVRRTQKFRLSGFLSPLEQEVAQTVAANYDEIKIDFFGGYDGAERQRAVFLHRDFAGQYPPDAEITVIRASWRDTSRQLSQRDALGTFCGIGFDRSALGDILMRESSASFLVDKKIAEALKMALDFIGGAKIAEVEEVPLSEITPREKKVKEIRASVASLRLDAIVAAGYGISRGRASEDIEAEKVQVNWQTPKNAAQSVKAGDVLSLRGRGRLEVAEIGGKTKKGRTCVVLKRYI